MLELLKLRLAKFSPILNNIAHGSQNIPATGIVDLGATDIYFAARVNVTVQSESQSGPTSIKVWQNPGMICPVIGNPDRIWGKPVPVDFCDWPVAVPNLTFGAKMLTLTMGAYAAK